MAQNPKFEAQNPKTKFPAEKIATILSCLKSKIQAMARFRGWLKATNVFEC